MWDPRQSIEASNLSEPCKAARVELRPAKLQPASVEQSSSRAIDSHRSPSIPSQRFPMGPPAACHRPPRGGTAGKPFRQPASKYHQNIIKILTFHSKIALLPSQQRPEDSKTMKISLEKCVSGFTASSWRFQTINHGFAAAS